MASLSNINGIFDVHSTGAIQFNGNHGASGQILKSNGNAAPTWIPQSDIVGAYLPLAGGTLTGATATASGISFTVGGNLTVGSTSKATNTVVQALSNDDVNAGFEARGASQGTGYFYAGQSGTHGGGMFYNGNGIPAFAAGETNDAISFYRRDANVQTVVFDFMYNSNNVRFKGGINVAGNTTVAGVTTVAGKISANGGIDGLTLANGGISGSNYNIAGVNQLTIADPGEGIVFTGTTTLTLAVIDDTVDDKLKLHGATQLDLNSTARITNLVDPTGSQDAATKAYVDSQPQGDITGVTAGTGMTGGGTSGSVTLNVIGGSGITANANDITVDSTVVRTTGAQSIAGVKTYTDDSAWIGGNSFIINDAATATAAMVRVPAPGGAGFDGPSTSTGAIKIKMPVASNNNNVMMSFDVKIYDYAANECVDMTITGYAYSTVNWNNQTVVIHANQANRDYTVRFGDDGTSHCVWIGELTSAWSHIKVGVFNFLGGHSVAEEDYGSGWDITIESAFDNVQDTKSNNLPVARTATTLQTARTIAGVSFNGSANISLNNNAITNGAGYTTNAGTVTSVATGSGLTGGTINSTGTLSLDRPDSQLGAVLATYGTTAGASGRIRCTAPFNTNSSKMFSIEITIYNSYAQHNYVVSAYMYSTTNQWLNPKAIYTTTGTASPDIYVGRDGNGKAYISIANGNYTGVLVHNMTRGYTTSLADTYDPWTITIDAGNENSVGVATSQVWTTANHTPGNYLPLAGGIMSGNIGRSAWNSGYQVGGYNNIGASHAKTNPIHAIGTSYLPTATALSNMYGIGYTRGDTSFMGVAQGSGWGLYVASDGDARIFLDSSAGDIYASNKLCVNAYANQAGGLLFSAGQTTGTTRSLNLRNTSPTSDPSSTEASESTGITWGQRTDGNPYYIIKPTRLNFGGGNYSKLTLNWHTGIRIGAQKAYGGTKFYNDSPDIVGEGGVIMNVGVGNNNIGVVNALTVGGAVTWSGGGSAESNAAYDNYASKTYNDAARGHLGGYYTSGGTEKPNASIFGAGKARIAMLGSGNLGFGGPWNDVFWMSAYTGGDVKRSTAIVSSKYDNTSVWVVKQPYDSSSWGTGYLFWNSGNFTPGNYLPLAGGTMTGALVCNSTFTTNSSIIANSASYFNQDIGIGFTSGNIGGRLNIRLSAANQIAIKNNLNGHSNVTGLLSYTSASMNSGGYHMVFQAAPTSGSDTNMLLCNLNGNLRNRNNSYGQYSDETIKENITDATPKLEDVKKLKVKNFNFIGDDLKQIGLIAQETEKVFPGLVEDDLNPQGDRIKSLKYSVLVPILVKAIQELEARVKELENK